MKATVIIIGEQSDEIELLKQTADNLSMMNRHLQKVNKRLSEEVEYLNASLENAQNINTHLTKELADIKSFINRGDQ